MNRTLIQKAKHIDLLFLVSRYTLLHKEALTNGGEYAGPCPKCGGNDRFRVQPNNPGGGIWFCRKCTGEVWKDAISKGLLLIKAFLMLLITSMSIPQGFIALMKVKD